jgi:hypothetical protein
MAINCGRPTKIEAKRTHSTLDRTAARAGAQSSPPCSFNLLTNTMDFREKHRCSMACKQIGLILLSRRLQDWPIEKSPKIPEEALKEWCQTAQDSGIRQMQQVAKTLTRHQRGILNWWKHRINNGRMEGTNNKIKTLLRQTYGLRDERYFILKLYSLHHSRLTLLG